MCQHRQEFVSKQGLDLPVLLGEALIPFSHSFINFSRVEEPQNSKPAGLELTASHGSTGFEVCVEGLHKELSSVHSQGSAVHCC